MSQQLRETVLDFLDCFDTCSVGIATVETLAGGPPSSDLTYVMPKAKSAICFGVPLDQSLILPFLSKEDRRAHEHDNIHKSALATGIAQRLADYLNQKGHPSAPVAANDVYRTDTPLGVFDMCPPLSHRYLAVRSGVGQFGFSGNVLTRNAGAAVLLGSVVTEAELEPTDPLPDDSNYCDNCRLCIAACPSGFVSPHEKVQIMLGGIGFSYSKRCNYSRCGYVCGGYTGLHSSGRWSTWSPGRFPIPDKDEELMATMSKAMSAWSRWPQVDGGYYNVLVGKRVWLTCGNCQLVCTPDPEERKLRYDTLIRSGVIVQSSEGTLESVSPDGARRLLASRSSKERALYEEG